MKITKGRLIVGFGGAVVAAGLSFFSGDVPDNDGVNWGETWKDFVSSGPEVETNRANREAYAATVRNPLNIPAGEAGATSVVYESRVPVYMDDVKFDVVGRLQYSDGTYVSRCTATLSDVRGYEVTSGASLGLSAAHCMLDDDHKFLPIGNFTFVMNYVDTNGQLVEFSSKLAEASALEIKEDGIDLAAFTLQTPVPDGLSLAVAIPDYNFSINEAVSAIGYSADKNGAYIDNCNTSFVNTNLTENTCDVTSGASGGPLVTVSNTKSFEYGAIAMGIAPNKMTFHSRITSEFLDDVSFLEREGAQSSVSVQAQRPSRQCVEVTASMLNIRDGRSSEFNVIAKAERGSQFVELDRVGSWSKIQLPDINRSAYVHNGHTRSYDC
jgi:V8-like Glu-specific endopeptidase